MPTGEQFRHLAGVYAVEESRLRDAAVAIETIGDHAVFDGVMLSTSVEFSAEAAAQSCRAAAADCVHLAAECHRRAAVADAWADHHRAYERALRTWRANVERSGVGARPDRPQRPAPWVDR